MSIVGIIANPASGKDIRRLVAHASVFDNNEKVNIVRRVLLGLDAVGVNRALLMPDYAGISERAANGLKLTLGVESVPMTTEWTQEDSTRAATIMREQGAAVIITLGGDGTNRVVAKGCGETPLVAISTGTNNVFPTLIEGTVAGLGAGLVAQGIVSGAEAIRQTNRLEIWRNDAIADIALVDIVVYAGQTIGARAIWHEDELDQIILTHPEPYSIGFSSIGGYLDTNSSDTTEGMAIEVGQGPLHVLAPIAPGLVRRIGIKAHRRLRVGQGVDVLRFPSVLALDGERTLVLHKPEPIQVRLSGRGPRVIDIRATMRAAAVKGYFVRDQDPPVSA